MSAALPAQTLTHGTPLGQLSLLLPSPLAPHSQQPPQGPVFPEQEGTGSPALWPTPPETLGAPFCLWPTQTSRGFCPKNPPQGNTQRGDPCRVHTNCSCNPLMHTSPPTVHLTLWLGGPRWPPGPADPQGGGQQAPPPPTVTAGPGAATSPGLASTPPANPGPRDPGSHGGAALIRCKCTVLARLVVRLGRTETLITGNCNFCYQSNTDQKGSLSPPLTCETSQLYSLEMTGALNSRAGQMATINHV